MIDELQEVGSLEGGIKGYNDEFAHSLNVMNRPKHAGGRPPKHVLDTANRELLVRRYDGRKATLEALVDETGVPIYKWSEWARELKLSNRLQPSGHHTKPAHREDAPRGRTAGADAPDTPDAPETVETDDGEISASDELPEELAEGLEAPTPIREISPPTATPSPARIALASLAWDEQQLLGQLIRRLPRRWTPSERKRWGTAFEGLLDLVVATVPEGTRT